MDSNSNKNLPTVLVVDDISLNLSNVEQTLKGKFQVVAVNSGSRALKYIKQHRPDIILLDIRMEDMDGIQTLKEIRAMDNGKDIPVIMLTSKRDRATVLESAALGIFDYIIKPFVPKELLKRVQNVYFKTTGKNNVEENNTEANNSDDLSKSNEKEKQTETSADEPL